jgi:hypothetical protein
MTIPNRLCLLAATVTSVAVASTPAFADGYLRIIGHMPGNACIPSDLGQVRSVVSFLGWQYAITSDGSTRTWGWTGGVGAPPLAERPGYPVARMDVLDQGGFGTLITTYGDGLLQATGYSPWTQFPSSEPFAVPGLVKLMPGMSGWVGLFDSGELRTLFSASGDYTIAVGVIDIASDGGPRIIYRTSDNIVRPVNWQNLDSNGCIDFETWPPCGDYYDWYPFTSQNCLRRPDDIGHVHKMTAGPNRIIVVRTDGTAVGWGYNHLGQCEFPTSLGDIEDIKCMGNGYVDSNVVLRRDGSVTTSPAWYWRPIPQNLGRVSSFADSNPAPGWGAGDARLVISDTPQPLCTGNLTGYDPANYHQRVDGEDLGVLLASWGNAERGSAADFNGDGIVDGADLGTLLNAWGECPF